MHSKIVLPIAMLAIVSGCGDVEQSSNAEAAHSVEQADSSFTVPLDPATTEESITPQIVAAGHGQIAAMCEAEPGASVRIFSPLASGAYEDISCASVLDGDEATRKASAALVTDENDGPIGTVQQRWSPFGLGCTIATGLAYLFASHVLCDHPKAERPKACRNVTDAGFFGLSVMCVFI
jgi:hypothetical protein